MHAPRVPRWAAIQRNYSQFRYTTATTPKLTTLPTRSLRSVSTQANPTMAAIATNGTGAAHNTLNTNGTSPAPTTTALPSNSTTPPSTTAALPSNTTLVPSNSTTPPSNATFAPSTTPSTTVAPSIQNSRRYIQPANNQKIFTNNTLDQASLSLEASKSFLHSNRAILALFPSLFLCISFAGMAFIVLYCHNKQKRSPNINYLEERSLTAIFTFLMNIIISGATAMLIATLTNDSNVEIMCWIMLALSFTLSGLSGVYFYKWWQEMKSHRSVENRRRQNGVPLQDLNPTGQEENP